MLDKIKRLPFEKILAFTSVFVLIFIIGLATYDKVGKSDVNVLITLESSKDPFATLPQIVHDSIMNVREVDKNRNEYVVTISTRRSRKELLESIMDNKSVKDAKIHHKP